MTTDLASLPPAGLPGLDPAWSRLVTAPSADGSPRTWHLLDTGPLLEARGVVPVGTVLAVHGNPTWSYLWRDVVAQSLEQADAVGQGRHAATGGAAWRVVAVDQLEMGWSERGGTTRRLADRVRDLGLLTDALGLEGPVVTLGHDWGGIVSLGWAVDHPELLSGVIVTNTTVNLPPDATLPVALRLALAANRVGTVDTTAFLDTTLAIGHPPVRGAVRDAFRAPYGRPARRLGIGAFVRDIPAQPGHPSRRELARIGAGVRRLRVPALVLWGPKDPVFGDRDLADLLERLPHADVHRFEGAGHLVVEDADVAGTALAWLESRRPLEPVRAEPVGIDDLPLPAAPALAAPTHGGTDSEDWRPLWSELEARADDGSVALVELAPRGGTRPREVSWRLLARRVREIAAGLAASGVKPGDRVSLLVPPGADLTAALYACLRIGAVVVVADAGLGLGGLTRAVRGARPKWIIGVPIALGIAGALGWPGHRISTVRLSKAKARALGARISLPELARRGRDAELPPPPGPDDPAAVFFTSGSTGPAKGVKYTQRRLAGIRDALQPVFGASREVGVVAGFAPFALLGPAFGCRTASPDMDVTRPATLTASGLADAVRAVDAGSVFLSPAALRNIVDTAGDLDDDDRAALARVRTVLSAGAPVGEPLLARAAEVLPNTTFHTPYGMTEGLLVTDITLDEIRASADAVGPSGGVPVGRAAPNARIRIAPLDEDGRATGAPTEEPGVTGEVLVTAPHVLDGYDRLWRTDHASRIHDGDERWHRTGDVGRFDAEGRLWVEGRLPHVIVTDAGVVTPVGVEQAAERVAGVRRAAAVGVGPRGVHQLVLIAETEPPAEEAAVAPLPLADAVRDEVGRPVAAVLTVPALPTDIRHNSKIDRAALATWASGVLAGGPMTAPKLRRAGSFLSRRKKKARK